MASACVCALNLLAANDVVVAVLAHGHKSIFGSQETKEFSYSPELDGAGFQAKSLGFLSNLL